MLAPAGSVLLARPRNEIFAPSGTVIGRPAVPGSVIVMVCPANTEMSLVPGSARIGSLVGGAGASSILVPAGTVSVTPGVVLGLSWAARSPDGMAMVAPAVTTMVATALASLPSGSTAFLLLLLRKGGVEPSGS